MNKIIKRALHFLQLLWFILILNILDNKLTDKNKKACIHKYLVLKLNFELHYRELIEKNPMKFELSLQSLLNDNDI